MFAKVVICLAVVCALFGTLNAYHPHKIQEQDDCPEICPLMYAPICSTDGVNYMEFSSPCELEVNNCRLKHSGVKPFVVAALDMCRTELVNGMDSLLLKLGNVNMEKPECMKPCTHIYNPVCISNGKYRALAASPCIMDSINCALDLNMDHFKVLQKETC